MAINRRTGALPWGLLVAAMIVLMGIGLWRTLYWISTPEIRQEARIGELFIYAGSAASIAAAAWSHLRHQPMWVSILVAAPGALIGGSLLTMPDSLFPHIAALIALPAAFAGLLGGVLDRLGGRAAKSTEAMRLVDVRENAASFHRRGWPGVILWSILVVASIVLMATGLGRSFFIGGYHPVPGLEEDARVGSLYLLAGSAASLAAAVWSFLRGHPHWVTACVAAPAIVVGGVALVVPVSNLRQLVSLLALPGAVAGMIGGLVDRGYRRTR